MARGAYLVVLSGPDAGELVKLEPSTDALIGREKGMTLCLTDDGVSRRHARISTQGAEVVLEDLGSHNGTFLGEVAVKKQALQPDDFIRVGANTVVKFSITDSIEEEFQRRLVAAALRDPLTGVYSRRFLQERLAAEVGSARRHMTPLSLLIVDVDRFKGVNDRHGHLAGDAVLKTLAQGLQAALRREDVLARFGGEEFVVVARGTTLEGAEQLGERLRALVEVLDYSWLASKTSPLRVTVSVGVAQLADGMSETGLLHKADSALYLAKRGGRNRVVALL